MTIWCMQLLFIAHLLTHEVPHAPKDAAAFIDHHILRWIEPFSARVAQRCNTQFYAGLALVTAVVLKRLRERAGGGRRHAADRA
jgi:TorA maturation chaperone TorD